MRPAVAAALAAAIGVGFSALALAEPMTKAEYQAARKIIDSDYKGAKVGCEPMSANVKDICLADVTGREGIALAELEFQFQPGTKTRNDVRVARAQATYALAREKCDDKAGNAKDVCVKEAEATHVAARADAKAQLKTSEANAVAGEKIADARMDADEAKRAADYAVAKEKCEALAGAPKALCLADAKKLYDK